MAEMLNIAAFMQRLEKREAYRGCQVRENGRGEVMRCPSCNSEMTIVWRRYGLEAIKCTLCGWDYNWIQAHIDHRSDPIANWMRGIQESLQEAIARALAKAPEFPIEELCYEKS